MAVHLPDAALARTRASHCCTGAVPDRAKASHVTINEHILPPIVMLKLATAPKDADDRSWRC